MSNESFACFNCRYVLNRFIENCTSCVLPRRVCISKSEHNAVEGPEASVHNEQPRTAASNDPTYPGKALTAEDNDVQGLGVSKNPDSETNVKKSPVAKYESTVANMTEPPDDDEHTIETNEETHQNQQSQEIKTDSNTSKPAKESKKPDRSEISYLQDNESDLLDSVFANAKDPKLIDRLLGCVYGQALGDAYGLSTEFENRSDVARNYPDPNKIIPFPDYELTHHSSRWKRGDWTDDTDQWILILETLSKHNGDEKEFAQKLYNWIRHGYRELGDWGGLGLGANVSQVVHSTQFLKDPHKASEDVWERGNRFAAPNGAVMRCSASAFFHFKNIDTVISSTIAMCKVTHFDPRCIASCLAVCLAITYLLNDENDHEDIEFIAKKAQEETIKLLGDNFPSQQCDDFKWHIEKDRTLEELNLDEERSIGYTYKCLGSGFYGLRSTSSFEQTLNDLIRYGGDADTNGAVCGTMYGARHGYKKLPYEWLRAMPYKKWLDKKIIKCLEQMDLLNNTPMDTQSSNS